MNTQIPLFEPTSDWTPPDILPEFDKADAIAIDLETCDPNLSEKGPGWVIKNGFIAGFAVGLVKGNDLEKYYLPIAHQAGGNLDRNQVLRYMRDLGKTTIPKLFHNCLYDIGWSSTEDIHYAGPIFDTQFSSALLDENRYSYSLDNLSKDWLGGGKDETLLREAGAAYGFKGNTLKANMWRLPARHVGPYAEGDVNETVGLWRHTKELLTRDNLNDVMQLEMDLVPMLIEMRQRGIRVDEDKADEVGRYLISKKVDLQRQFKLDYGVAVDSWDVPAIARAFDKHSIDYPRTAKTAKPSFTKDWLDAHPHPLPRAIRQMRKMDQAHSMVIKGMIGGHCHNGRIHTELHPMKSDEGGTVAGRFSCSNPNLQQTSGRDAELAPLVRGIFLPEQGQAWAALDYSAQEPRLTVHFAALTHQTGALEAVEQYNSDPKTDYHQMVADLAGISRKDAKQLNLGLAYGMGQVKLCNSLGLPTEWITGYNGNQREIAGPEGLEIIRKYHEGSPFISGIMKTTTSKAIQRGWIRTIGGRLCRFNMYEPKKWDGSASVPKDQAIKKWGINNIKQSGTHKALNRLIQGSAADMTKLAMRDMYREGIVPMLQMHDELDLSVDRHDSRIWKRAEEIMSNAVSLQVPLVVDCEFGDNWGAANQTWEEYQDAA